jgi:hypothetical protein
MSDNDMAVFKLVLRCVNDGEEQVVGTVGGSSSELVNLALAKLMRDTADALEQDDEEVEPLRRAAGLN